MVLKRAVSSGLKYLFIAHEFNMEQITLFLLWPYTARYKYFAQQREVYQMDYMTTDITSSLEDLFFQA
jgi:hypothetical protein